MSFVDWFMASFCIAFHIVIALQTIVIVGRAITLEREPSKKSKDLISKRLQRELSVITLQGTIKKSPILLSLYWKNE